MKAIAWTLYIIAASLAVYFVALTFGALMFGAVAYGAFMGGFVLMRKAKARDKALAEQEPMPTINVDVNVDTGEVKFR